MRLNRKLILVLVLVAVVGQAAASRVRSRRLSEPESEEVEREVEAGLKELEDEPTPEELSKVKVHVSIPKAEGETSGDAEPKLGKPSWREAVQKKIEGANRALALLLKVDAESKGLRAQLSQLKDEEAEPEEIDRQQKVVDDNLVAIREAREAYHSVIQQLAWLVNPHPGEHLGPWEGNMEDPLVAKANELIRTAAYDGTFIQNEQVGPARRIIDPDHTYQTDNLWDMWKPGREHPLPVKIFEREEEEGNKLKAAMEARAKAEEAMAEEAAAKPSPVSAPDASAREPEMPELPEDMMEG